MVLAGGIKPSVSLYESGALSTELCQPCHVLAETRAVGRSYGSRGALMQRERRPVRSFIRAEYPLEVGIHAHDDVARDVGIRDGSVTENERAPPRTHPLRRHANVAGTLDRFVWGLVVADHLVLLPVGGGLGSPPVNLRVSFALVRLLSDARAYPRANATNRPAD